MLQLLYLSCHESGTCNNPRPRTNPAPSPHQEHSPMKKICLSLTLVAAMAAPAVMHASPLYGTFGFNYRSVTVTPATTGGNPAPLDPYRNLNSIDYQSVVFAGPGTSAPLFPNPTTGVITGSTSLYPNSPNGGNGTPYTLTFGNYGTFVETAAPKLVSQTT